MHILFRKGLAMKASGVSLFLVFGGMAAEKEKWAWEGCPDVTVNDFRKVSLVDKSMDPTLDEPVKMDVAWDGRVFIAERKGKLKIRGLDGSISVAGSLEVYSERFTTKGQNNEMGLQGMALDPGFKENGFIYLHYAPLSARIWRISRFTINGGRLETSSERILLEIPVQRLTCCHTGGALTVDARGDLWISTGNNTTNPVSFAEDGYVKESDPNADDQGHSANTNDLRGKILRIHPTDAPVDGRNYSIPDGNLFPKETAKARPEIYVMGLRNPYAMSLDPATGWLAFSDVGPDNKWDTEEFNLFKKPGNAGWPYFAGSEGNPHYAYRLAKDPAKPQNLSPNNTGLVSLPPSQGAIIGYTQSAAISGPIYRYDPSLDSKVKLPPHFSGKWFLTDFNKGFIKIATVDDSAAGIKDNRYFATEGFVSNPVQMMVGPEGAMYIVEYSGNFNSSTTTRISRLEYTGSCLPDHVGILGPRRASPAGTLAMLHHGLERSLTLPASEKGILAYDIHGKLAWSYTRKSPGAERVYLPSSLGYRVYHLRYAR